MKIRWTKLCSVDLKHDQPEYQFNPNLWVGLLRRLVKKLTKKVNIIILFVEFRCIQCANDN